MTRPISTGTGSSLLELTLLVTVTGTSALIAFALNGKGTKGTRGGDSETRTLDKPSSDENTR